jgi:hypothetical protein
MTRWTAGVQFPTATGSFSLFRSFIPDSGAHPASYPMDTEGSFQEIKRPGREDDRTPLCSAEVRNGKPVHLLPHKSSWRGA